MELGMKPESVAKMRRLYKRQARLLKMIAIVQDEIENTINFINGNSPFEALKREAEKENKNRIEGKQILLNLYRSNLVEINKQSNLLWMQKKD